MRRIAYLIKTRTMMGAFLFLLAFTLVLSALLSDEWITSEASEGSREDLDSDWWHISISLGTREGRSDLEMYDPFIPVVREHYNHTVYRYEEDLEQGSLAINYSMILTLFLLPIAVFVSLLTYNRYLSGKGATTFAVICTVLLIFGSYMFLTRIGSSDLEEMVPDDEKLEVLIEEEDISGLSDNSTFGTSTYLLMGAIGVLVPTNLLFIGIKKEKTPRKREMRKVFFKDPGIDDEDDDNLRTIYERKKKRVEPTVFEVDEQDPPDPVKENGDQAGIRSGRL